MDVISISSGTDDDSDIEIVSVYNDTKDDSKEMVREWSSVPSPYIDLTESFWEPLQRRNRRTGNQFPWVDLSYNSLSVPLSDNNSLSESKVENWEYFPCTSPELKEEQKPLDCLDNKLYSSPLSCHRFTPSKNQLKDDGAPLPPSPEPSWNPHSPKIQQNASESPGTESVTPGILDEIPPSSLASPRLGFETVNTLQDTEANLTHFWSTERSLGESEEKNGKESEDLGGGFPDFPNAASPWSPYYCPSEVDSRLYSDSSSMQGSQDGVDGSSRPPSPPAPSQFLMGGLLQQVCKTSPPHRLTPAEGFSERNLSSPPPPSPGAFSHSPGHPLLSPTHWPSERTVSPTSTEILASDTPDWLVDDDELTLTNDSPASLLSCASTETEDDAPRSSSGDSDGEELSEMEAGFGSREASRKDRMFVSRGQLNWLKCQMGRPIQELGGSSRPEPAHDDNNDEEEEEDPGPTEPMCRQGLSLVHSAMEERCHGSTLQLLTDFLHPRLYPPPDVISHVIRGILLDRESTPAVVLQAYGLLMRIQKNHPATEATVQWDWGLLASTMEERGSELRLVPCLLLQYVIQTLHDDFHQGLQRSHGSIAKATLSCSRNMTHVRDVIDWLVAAVMSSTGDPGEQAGVTEMERWRERDQNLKIVLILQKMLALAVEVDCSPTTSANKICEDLLQVLIGSTLHRSHRQLLLQTLESSLLQCTLVELLLQHVCRDKTEQPMSLSLILHFLRSATMPTEPTDGDEGWQRWRELLQLLWMLVLSYQEVADGNLRRPIAQRATCSHPPVWTTNDDITRAELQKTADSFLSRAAADIGQALPPQVQGLFSFLQDHLLCFCRR